MYPDLVLDVGVVPQPVTQPDRLFEPAIRQRYMLAAIENGWSRSILLMRTGGAAHHPPNPVPSLWPRQ